MKPTDSRPRRITYTDRCRLGQLVTCDERPTWGNQYRRAKLEVLLDRAKPVEMHETPEDLVTMNSTVVLSVLPSEKRRTVTLVYPEDVDLPSDGVSVLEPLGTALLGRKVGDVIQCPVATDQRRLRISKLVYQPEQAGAFHL